MVDLGIIHGDKPTQNTDLLWRKVSKNSIVDKIVNMRFIANFEMPSTIFDLSKPTILQLIVIQYNVVELLSICHIDTVVFFLNLLGYSEDS